jgi:glycosyltransferase involved in cell wall biosynthesis
MQALARADVRGAFDAFALVSRWQLGEYRKCYDLPLDRCRVMPNGVAPVFLRQFRHGAEALAPKSWPPLVAYTSTPFRGLDRLLAIFPRVRTAIPGARLAVFSSMQVYHHDARRDAAEFGALYELARSMEGVEYVGSLPQPELARRLREVLVLAYPCHFAETSCIAVLEALASGCRVVTTRLGALPETCGGFADLVEPHSDPTEFDRQFTEAVVGAVLGCAQGDGQASAERLTAQLEAVNDRCNWARLAFEWERWLRQVAAQR